MSQISVHELDCGMPLIVERIPGIRSAGVSWLLPAGAATDDENRLGVAAMTSELLLRGAGARDSREDADAFDGLGVSRSADVGRYFMRVGGTMLGSRMAEALPLFVDIVRRPRMDADALDPVRDLALQAIESLRDDPQQRAVLGARSRHFAPPFNRTGLGTPEGLRAIDRETLVSSWNQRARPGRSILAVAGAIDASELVEQLNGLLEGWAGMSDEPASDGDAVRGYAHEEDETNQVQVILIHDAPSECDDASLLERVIVSVLSGGMSGRLFTEVREKRGLCYGVHANYASERDYGRVLADVATTPERAQEALEVLVGELERINTPDGCVQQDEFDRAIVGMKSRLIFSGESSSARAMALAVDQFKLGRPRSLREIGESIDRITLDQVNDHLASRSLGRVTIQTLGPEALREPGHAAGSHG